jgi:hypothetical protein
MSQLPFGVKKLLKAYLTVYFIHNENPVAGHRTTKLEAILHMYLCRLLRTMSCDTILFSKVNNPN